MKAVLCNESGLPSLHGFAATRMEPAIVYAVCGPLKTIDCQRKIPKEYIEADGQMKLVVGKISKGKSALRSHYRSPWHQAATDALQVCMYGKF